MRTLSALILAALMVASLTAAPPKDPYPNVQVLSYSASKDDAPIPICTIWPADVNGFTVWVTAAHCVQDENGEPDLTSQFYIGSLKAALHSMNFEMDLATLIGPNVKAPYHLAAVPPKYGDACYILGHPWAQAVVFLTKGWIAAPSVAEPEEVRWTKWTAIQAPIIGGESGSPVFNSKGEVISVVQFGWARRSFDPLFGGATITDLSLFLYSR